MRADICTSDDYDTRDGTGERDYIHIADLADAHGAALDYLAGQGTVRAMNLGYGRGSTVLEVVKTLESVLGRKLPWRLAPRRAGDPAVAVSDVSRLHQTLDWRPRFDSLELILRSALAWRTGDSSLRAPLSLQRRLDQIGQTAATAP